VTRSLRIVNPRSGASRPVAPGAARCYQCATCTTVCDLAKDRSNLFPRRQMLLAQWGLVDELIADPSIWLCHQCHDCSTRCPRDAKPGDVLQAARSWAIEAVAAPRFLGTLVARAATTWPLLLGLPILFWVVLLWVWQDLRVPEGQIASYGQVVPHALIYGVFFPVAALVLLSATISTRRLWALWGGTEARRPGGFFPSLVGVLGELLLHNRFARCGSSKPRRWSHLALFWGFAGAALTSGLIIVAMYGLGMEMPIPQLHPFKMLGNLSAVLLVVGGVWILLQRTSPDAVGSSTAFDNFFLGVVLLLIATGVATELGRYLLPPVAAFGLYVVHLGTVLCLFATFPFSKFSHLLFRTLALVHERLTVSALSGEELKKLRPSKQPLEHAGP
jgi:quinone-modifying oxidoreductase, subunit QmoC